MKKQRGEDGFGELYEVWSNISNFAKANGCDVDSERSYIQTEGDLAKIIMRYRGKDFEVSIYHGIVQ